MPHGWSRSSVERGGSLPAAGVDNAGLPTGLRRGRPPAFSAMPDHHPSASLTGQERRQRDTPRPDRLLDALAESLRLLGALPDHGPLVHTCLATLGEAFAATRLALVIELRDARSRASHYQVVHEWVRPGRASWQARGLATLPADQAVLFASVCRTGIGFQGGLGDVPSPQRDILQLLGTATLACAPFAAGDPHAGLLCLEDERASRNWTRAEINTLTIAARNLGALRLRDSIDQRLLAERQRAVELARANEATGPGRR